jgi:hypothetical protein
MDQQQTLIIDQIVGDHLVMVLRKKELEDLVELGVSLGVCDLIFLFYILCILDSPNCPPAGGGG